MPDRIITEQQWNTLCQTIDELTTRIVQADSSMVHARVRRLIDVIACIANQHVKESFSRRNRTRCESPKGYNHKLSSWSLSDWLTATTGELGEAANIIKKLNRSRDGIVGNHASDCVLWRELGEELADTAIYLDLLAQAAGFDLSAEIEKKFAETSAKIGYTE